MNKTQALGCAGEDIVTRFLEKQGYQILARNYKPLVGGICVGEIDVVAQKDEFVAFVEVKTRKFAHFPISTVVTRGKQRRIIKAAKMFLMKRGWYYERMSRFDVATVLYSDGQHDSDNQHDIEYIENAFGV